MKPVPILLFFPLLPFSSLHYAGSLTLFDRMCYLQPPAAVPLSLSSHRWQLNPTAACHRKAGRKWWCRYLKEGERGERDRPQSTSVDFSCIGTRGVLLCGRVLAQLPYRYFPVTPKYLAVVWFSVSANTAKLINVKAFCWQREEPNLWKTTWRMVCQANGNRCVLI